MHNSEYPTDFEHSREMIAKEADRQKSPKNRSNNDNAYPCYCLMIQLSYLAHLLRPLYSKPGGPTRWLTPPKDMFTILIAIHTFGFGLYGITAMRKFPNRDGYIASEKQCAYNDRSSIL